MKTTKCRICSHEGLSALYEVDGYSVLKCRRCGVQFVDNLPSPATLAAFYQADTDMVYEDERNLANLTYYDNIVKRKIQNYQRSGKVLDVGCSAGHFLAAMRPEFEVQGIEISAQMAEKAAGMLGNCVHVGTLDSYEAPAQSFDIVTFFDSLDHCIDPHQEIAKAWQLLKPGGLLVVKVHNIDCLLARLTGKRFYAVMLPAHLFYFNRRSLKALVERHGFTWLGHDFIAHRLFLKSVFFRLCKSRTDTVFYRAYQWLSTRAAGEIPVYKNLHDIITCYARKNGTSADAAAVRP